MSTWVKVVGSAEAVLYLSRVPTIGEHVTACGLPRRVAKVEHHPLPLPFSLSVAAAGGYQLVGGELFGNVSFPAPAPWAATITVEE